ncbi:MAG: threonine aldolase, partial [Eudoraea sp.]
AEVLETLLFVKKVEPTETNIIIFELNESKMGELDFMELMRQNNIQMIGMGQGKLRMVTHLDYTNEMHQYVIKVLKSI